MALDKYKLAKEEHGKDHVFVLGNTKYLKDLTDAEAEILYKNGDARIELAETTESEAASEVVAKKGKRAEPVIVNTHE